MGHHRRTDGTPEATCMTTTTIQGTDPLLATDEDTAYALDLGPQWQGVGRGMGKSSTSTHVATEG
jgi:hypothetical protein